MLPRRRGACESLPSPVRRSRNGYPDGMDPGLSLKRRAARVVRRLDELYPDVRCTLDFADPLQLLVATILSAQCTDKRVNEVTPALFARYPDAAALAAADRATVEEMVRSTGFFRAKTNSLLTMSQALCERFGGEVPARLDDLVT